MKIHFIYFFLIANVMFLTCTALGGFAGVLLINLFNIEDTATGYMILMFMVFNTFLIWLWYSDLTRKAFIEFMQNK